MTQQLAPGPVCPQADIPAGLQALAQIFLHPYVNFPQAIPNRVSAPTSSDAAPAVAGIGLIFFALALLWLPPDGGSEPGLSACDQWLYVSHV